MGVKKYVSVGEEMDQHAPDFTHEVSPTIEIIKNIFSTFNHENDLYSIIANVNEQNACADLVFITTRGIGVVELKGHYGQIHQKEESWYANNFLIKSGSHKQYKNPHKQVQFYAKEIRRRVIDTNLLGTSKIQLQTAVCFTHENAMFDRFKKWYYNKKEYFEEWENFQILSPKEIAHWVACLRFESNKDKQDGYAPRCLSNKEIEYITTDLLGAVEWSQIDNLMPDGKPYAYLSITNSNEGEEETYGLKLDQEIVGRKPDSCNFVIPDYFTKVSGKHFVITRTINGVFIEDISSKNGTYINGDKLFRKKKLSGDKDCVIYLGGKHGSGVCILEFSCNAPYTHTTTVTDK